MAAHSSEKGLTVALATLSIDIIAKLAEFRRDLGEAVGASDKAAGEIRKSFDGLKSFAGDFAIGLGAGIAGALAGGALVQWTSDTINAADELDRLSQSTGVSVEKLSQWGAVAKRNGLDVSDLAEQINELQIKLAETDKDTEGAGYALKQLGIDYKELKKLTSEEAFAKVAEGLAKVEDSGQKAAMAMMIGGDEYQKYIGVLNDIGAGGLQAAAITADQARAAADLKDQIAVLTTAGSDWSQAIVGGIVPALDETARALIDVISGTGGMTDEARKLARDGTITEWARGGITALTYLADAGSIVVRAFRIVGQTIGADLAIAGEAFTTLGTAAKQAIEGDYSKALDTVRGGMGRVKSISADASATLSGLWSEKTMGAQIRDRIADIKTLGAETAKAARPPKAKPAFDPVKAKSDAKAIEDADKKRAAARKKAGDTDEREAARALAEYEKLITSIRSKSEAERTELDGTAAVTEGQKMALDVMTQLRDGRLKLTDAQKQTAAAYLEELLANERANAARRQQIEIDAEAITNTNAVRDTMRERTEAIQEQIKAAKLEAQEAGLSASALATLKDARQLDTAAALEQSADTAAKLEDGEAIADLYRKQADAIRKLVGLQRNARTNAESARRDPIAGARAGLEAFRADLSNTAGDVQSAFGNIAGGIEGAMASAFSGSADGAKQLFATIKQEALKLLVIRPILQQLTGSGGGNPLGALVGAASSFFGGAGGNAGFGDYSSSGLAAAFGKATGGQVAAGSLHRVNERGPELISTAGKDYLMMGGAGGFVTPITPAAPSGSSRGPVSITYSPQITIDSRADRGAIMQDVAALNRRGQEEMMQTLKDRGVV